MRRLTFSLLAVVFYLIVGCSTRTYYVVRHADRPQDGADRLMSPEGETRAQVLAELLRSKHISHIFSTPYTRTQQTARPLSEAINVPVTEYSQDTLADFVRELKKHGNSLVVGHNDTILDTVKELGREPTVTSIGRREFDRMFIVTRKRVWLRPIQVGLAENRYGAVAH